jgi:serine phosphatase RsbU (regulator of sigma subunit)
VFEAPRAGDHHLGQFGADRVAELLLSSDRVSLQTLKDGVLEALEAFTGGTYEDDVAFLMLRARAEGSA